MRKNGREIKLKRVNELCIRTFLQTFIYIYSVKKKKNISSPTAGWGQRNGSRNHALRHEEAESCSFGITTSFQLNNSQPLQSFGLVKRWWLHKHVLRFVYLYIHFIPAFLFPLWICWLMQNAKPNRHLKKSNISWARDLPPFCWILYNHCWQIF